MRQGRIPGRGTHERLEYFQLPRGYHRTLHPNDYDEMVNARLGQASSREEVIGTLSDLREGLLSEVSS